MTSFLHSKYIRKRIDNETDTDDSGVDCNDLIQVLHSFCEVRDDFDLILKISELADKVKYIQRNDVNLLIKMDFILKLTRLLSYKNNDVVFRVVEKFYALNESFKDEFRRMDVLENICNSLKVYDGNLDALTSLKYMIPIFADNALSIKQLKYHLHLLDLIDSLQDPNNYYAELIISALKSLIPAINNDLYDCFGYFLDILCCVSFDRTDLLTLLIYSFELEEEKHVSKLNDDIIRILYGLAKQDTEEGRYSLLFLNEMLLNVFYVSFLLDYDILIFIGDFDCDYINYPIIMDMVYNIISSDPNTINSVFELGIFDKVVHCMKYGNYLTSKSALGCYCKIIEKAPLDKVRLIINDDILCLLSENFDDDVGIDIVKACLSIVSREEEEKLCYSFRNLIHLKLIDAIIRYDEKHNKFESNILLNKILSH